MPQGRPAGAHGSLPTRCTRASRDEGVRRSVLGRCERTRKDGAAGSTWGEGSKAVMLEESLASVGEAALPSCPVVRGVGRVLSGVRVFPTPSRRAVTSAVLLEPQGGAT